MPNTRSNAADYVGGVLDSIAKMQTRQTVAQREQPRPQLTGMQALFGGAIRAQKKMIEDRRLAEDQQREQAIALLESIPDSETNTPVKTRLLMEILNAKPGKKGIFDQLFNPNPDTQFGEELLAKFASVIPTQKEQQQITETRKPIEGKVDFGDGESNFALAGNQILYKDNEAFLPVLDKKSGKILLQSVDDVKGDKRIATDNKGTSETKSPQQKELENRAFTLAAIEHRKVGIDLTKLEDLPEEKQKEYIARAAAQMGQNYQAKDQVTGMKPDLTASQIEANKNKLPGTETDIETGRTKKETMAAAEEVIRQGTIAQSELIGLYSKYKEYQIKVKTLEEKQKSQGILTPTDERALASAKAELEGAKTSLRGRADQVKSNYGDYFDVTEDADGVPSAIVKRKEVGKGGIIPRTAKPSVKSPIKTAKGFDDVIKKGPGVVTPNGDSKYYVSDDVEIPQGAAMMKHNMVDDKAVIIDKTRIPDLADKQLKPNSIIQFNGKDYKIVFVSPSNTRFVMVENK